MKYIKIIPFLLFFSPSIFCQKDIDLELMEVMKDSTTQISDTIEYSGLGFSIPIQYYIKVANNGITPLNSNDTLFLFQYINDDIIYYQNPASYPIDHRTLTNIDLEPADTIILKIVFFDNYDTYATSNEGDFKECFEIIPSQENTALNELTPEDNIICYNRNIQMTQLSTGSEEDFTSFKIFPNPATEIINFNYALDEIQLYDMSGRELNDFTKVNKHSLDISLIEKGVYFIKGKWKNKTFLEKIIIE